MFARVLAFLRQPWATAENRAVLLVQMGVVVGASVLFSIGYEIQRDMRVIMDQHEADMLITGWDGLAWVAWPLAAPAILLAIRRYPLTRGQIVWGLGRLTLCSIALFVVVTNVRSLLRVAPSLVSDGPRFDWNHYMSTSLALLPVDFLTYYSFFSATFAIDYYFKHRRRLEEALQLRARAAQLESEVARAELQALRGQLNPHFLFNSFNAVSMLVRQQRNEAAIETIAQLGQLLRLAMERTRELELPMRTELDFVRRYLQIEQIRFGDKLHLEFDVHPDAEEGQVPNFLLQPLAENAIKHGISRLTASGVVRVAAARRGARLELIIENDGPDSTADAGVCEQRGGIGLANTRERLEKIYGADYRLELMHRDQGGMRIRLDLPWRERPLASSESNPHVDR